MTAGVWHGQDKLNQYRKRMLESASILVRLAFMLPRFKQVEKLILSSNLNINPSFFIFISIALSCVGILVGHFLPKRLPAQEAVGGALFLLLPYLILRIQAQRSSKQFNDMFPDALDLLSRSLRAGHALVSSLSMVSEQMEPPISKEFEIVVDEINFGLSLKEALLNLCERRTSTDLKFFSVAVMIQTETGGNLTQIMNNLSRILRERVQLKRQVNTLNAEAKVSAYLLIGLPIFLFCYFYVSNFDYISLLWRDQMGRYMLYFGLGMQVIGSIAMKKMIEIEV